MNKVTALQQIATRLRHHVLTMTSNAGSGHPSTCLSSAELMSCLFFDEMRYNIQDPDNPGNDEFIMSKGHASPILWAVLAEARIIPFEKLSTYRKFGSELEGHPTPRMPWIKYATGSLGQGLSAGLGMALGIRIKHEEKKNEEKNQDKKRPKSKNQDAVPKVYVMMGDGECAEGSVWEAAELASKLKVNNLVAILDANRLGQSGESLHGHHVKVWKRKFSAFGWKAFVINGHDIGQILKSFRKAKKINGPAIIIAKTIKGKGVPFIEDHEGWHGRILNDKQLRTALEYLGPLPEIDARNYLRKPRIIKEKKYKKILGLKPRYRIGEIVATRKAFGNAMAKLGIDKRIIGIDGDTKNSNFLLEFFEKYPERSIECYIAEQNMIGISQGLSAKGLIPVASTFSAFLTRAHDQIRMAGVAKANIKIVGSHAGVSIGEDGPSQMGLEDLSMMRSVPESTVLYPCDAVSAEALTQIMIQNNGINYLRTSRPKTPVIYKNNENFRIGGSKTLLKEGNTVVITAGITVHEALKAKELTKKKFILIDAYSIKPLDKSLLKACKGKKVIVVEDHYPEGGLGEAVRSLGIKVDEHLCIKKVSMSGSKEKLLRWHGIDAKSIAKAVQK